MEVHELDLVERIVSDGGGQRQHRRRPWASFPSREVVEVKFASLPIVNFGETLDPCVWTMMTFWCRFSS